MLAVAALEDPGQRNLANVGLIATAGITGADTALVQ